MSESTVAHSTSRSKRGYYLWREHGDRIAPLGGGKCLVPGVGKDFYEVNLAEESCNCPDYTNRHEEISEETGEYFWCKHMFAAMVFTIKNPEAADKADTGAEATPTEKHVTEARSGGASLREPSRQAPSACAGCGVPSGKPSEGGSVLSGKGPGQPLYCMDCKPGSLSREQASAAIETMSQNVGVA